MELNSLTDYFFSVRCSFFLFFIFKLYKINKENNVVAPAGLRKMIT